IGAGIAANNTPVSPWLLTFSMFFFFSLAGIKRLTECQATAEKHPDQGDRAPLSGRGYIVKDREVLAPLGISAGLCSVLVFLIFLT
ncbi:hypothetical protein ABTM32_22545, partial [Acinetobacter baumannii]